MHNARHARRVPGQRPFWPSLESKPRARPFCATCRHDVRDAGMHLSTAEHRRMTRPRTYGPVGAEAPSWRRALHDDDTGTARQNAAAARRLGIAQ